jgi:hypothetical protein
MLVLSDANNTVLSLARNTSTAIFAKASPAMVTTLPGVASLSGLDPAKDALAHGRSSLVAG